MLILNDSLQRAGISAYTRFSKVGYSQSGALSGLVIDKSNADDLIRGHSNVLIRESKLVDQGVTGLEALEWWQRLKMNEMPSTALFWRRKNGVSGN